MRSKTGTGLAGTGTLVTGWAAAGVAMQIATAVSDDATKAKPRWKWIWRMRVLPKSGRGPKAGPHVNPGPVFLVSGREGRPRATVHSPGVPATLRPPMDGQPRVVRAPRGTALRCKGWPQEAALRMLMNNLDPEVAERPQDLVVYGGTGKAARSWPAFDVIVRELEQLEGDETLLIQSGKAVGKFRTHPDAPRVLIANSNLVGRWATFDEFRRLEALGLTMYGQMTAGSWIYIGSQGIVQGTFETFVAARKAHEKKTGRAGHRWVLTAGLGGMGGAQPLAATMAGMSLLGVEIDPTRIEKRLKTRYLDERIDDLDQALAAIHDSVKSGRPRSIGLCANAADIYPELVKRGVIPDLVTEQTAAHDPLIGYIPQGLSLAEAAELRARDPQGYIARAKADIR